MIKVILLMIILCTFIFLYYKWSFEFFKQQFMDENKERSEQMKHKIDLDEKKIIEQLSHIIMELEAREDSSNSIIPEYHNISWQDLCDTGIELFERLMK